MKVRVIWKKTNPTDKKGYLRITSRIGNKTKTKNLPLKPLEQKYFNPKTERVRLSFPNSKEYNQTIDSIIDEISKKTNNVLLFNNTKKSFIDYFNKVIQRTTKRGTILKYENIRNLLLKYNTEIYQDIDIKFSDIHNDFINGFIIWLRNKGNSPNTITWKLKSFKSIINKGIKEREYKYEYHPFDNINQVLTPTELEILNKDDLFKLMNTNLVEVYRHKKEFGIPITNLFLLQDSRYKHIYSINDVRNFFLFQLFSQGIRVSDLQTLRWENFYVSEKEDDIQIRFKKRMVKVNEDIDILVNYNTLKYLIPYIPKDLDQKVIKNDKDEIESNFQEIESNKNEFFSLNNDLKFPVKVKDSDYEKYRIPWTKNDEGICEVSINDVGLEIINHVTNLKDKHKEEVEKLDFLGIMKLKESIGETDSKLNFLYDLLEYIQTNIKYEKEKKIISQEHYLRDNYEMFSHIIHYLSTNIEFKRRFCFPLLKNEDFKNVKYFDNMTELQYKRFTGSRSYYNRLLKVVQQQCGITKNLTSHISRHSYTSIMLEIGGDINLFDLMTSLGHKHLSTTQKYITKFTNPRVDNLNKKLSDFLNNQTLK